MIYFCRWWSKSKRGSMEIYWGNQAAERCACSSYETYTPNVVDGSLCWSLQTICP